MTSGIISTDASTSKEDNSVDPLFVKREDAKWTPPVDEDNESPFGVEVKPEEAEGPIDDEMKMLEKEKEGRSARELLDTALSWKTLGNEKFKQQLNDNAADAYFRGIVFARDLLKNPKWYPDLKHTEEEYSEARQVCEAMFTNLAMAQIKYAEGLMSPDNADKRDDSADQEDPNGEITSPKVALEEAARSADEALKLNPKSEKALYRRALALSRVASHYESIEAALNTLVRAKQDLLALVEINAQNREARIELQKVNEHAAKLRRQQAATEKKTFSFGNALASIDAKPQNIGDGGSKIVQTTGDGGMWFDSDWLQPTWPSRCVITVLKDDKPVSFTLAANDRLSTCVRTMTPNEEALFVFKEKGDAKKETSFTLKFLRHEIYAVQPAGLEKVFEEGYGDAPVALAEVCAHFRVLSSSGNLLFSSRWCCHMGGGKELMKKSEDPDKPPLSWTWAENCPWAPLEFARVKQGGKSEVRLGKKPTALDLAGIFPPGTSENVMITMDLKKQDPWLAGTIVVVELLRVSLPVESAGDARFSPEQTVAREEVMGAMLAAKEELALAERRFRRAVKFSRETDKEPNKVALHGLADVLLRMALSVLDGGNVTSQDLKTAQVRVGEAKSLVQEQADSLLSNMCQARIRLCDDDDFDQAIHFLDRALQFDLDYADAQALFRHCKAEQRKQRHARTVREICKAQQLLRECVSDDGLQCLERLGAENSITWDSIMETKVGVEIKVLLTHENSDIKKRAQQLLATWQDISKQERPMWDRPQ
eukprot:GEMP01018529.1.p1 GENE.GEMP01018529.1~~GEMP01018529.1.p1  ORF type:complete len:767 (+),score=238.32 GEMP01018529.1:127-2427(+)